MAISVRVKKDTILPLYEKEIEKEKKRIKENNKFYSEKIRDIVNEELEARKIELENYEKENKQEELKSKPFLSLNSKKEDSKKEPPVFSEIPFDKPITEKEAFEFAKKESNFYYKYDFCVYDFRGKHATPSYRYGLSDLLRDFCYNNIGSWEEEYDRLKKLCEISEEDYIYLTLEDLENLEYFEDINLTLEENKNE